MFILQNAGVESLRIAKPLKKGLSVNYLWVRDKSCMQEHLIIDNDSFGSSILSEIYLVIFKI